MLRVHDGYVWYDEPDGEHAGVISDGLQVRAVDKSASGGPSPVGAAATREEVLVSQATVDAAKQIRFTLSEPRTVQLKGVKEPVPVQSVAWRA